MDMNLAMFGVGAAILLLVVMRARHLRRFSTVKTKLEAAFDLSDLDFSGRTEYARCYSHQWALNNLYYKKHGRLGSHLQDQLRENTLVTFMLLALVLGSSAVVIGLLIVGSVVALGGAALIIFIGALIGVGPGEPRSSEEFLSHVSAVPLAELSGEDYVYVRIALRSIRRWIFISVAAGVVFLVGSPWAEMLPDLVGAVVAAVVGRLILEPALFLASISFVLSLLYMSAAIPVLFFFVPRALIRVLRKNPSETSAAKKTVGES